MTRRRALAALAAVTFASVVAWPRKTYGYLDVPTAQARGYWPARVLLDGVDVSKQCHTLDDRAGYVVLYKHRDGRPYIDPVTRRPAEEIRIGVVTYIPRARR